MSTTVSWYEFQQLAGRHAAFYAAQHSKELPPRHVEIKLHPQTSRLMFREYNSVIENPWYECIGGGIQQA